MAGTLRRSELQVPPRIHLDLYAENQAEEVKRLIALGATEVHWDKRPADADYVILADPEGNGSASSTRVGKLISEACRSGRTGPPRKRLGA